MVYIRVNLTDLENCVTRCTTADSLPRRSSAPKPICADVVVWEGEHTQSSLWD